MSCSSRPRAARQVLTPVRQAFWSGPFVEGWAVYAEALMVERGYDAGLPVAGRRSRSACSSSRTRCA